MSESHEPRSHLLFGRSYGFSDNDMTSVLLSGQRAGKVTVFCKAMGLEVKPYQEILLLRLSFGGAIRRFLPPRPLNFEKLWKKDERDSKWIKVWFDECAYLPR